MSIRRSFFAAVGALALVAGGLTGCSAGSEQQSAPAKGGVVELTVAASPTPHAKILQYINDHLAAKNGLKLKIIQFQDYIQPNASLKTGEVDANYFQTVPFLKQQEKKYGDIFDHGAGIHLEPLGVYSNKVKDIKDIKDGATIGIINDPANQARALRLLALNDLLKLPAGKTPTVAEVQNTPSINVHKLKFHEVDGPQLVRILDDVDAAVINGNLAQQGGKTPKDAIALEAAKDNPNLNILVWSKTTKKLAAIKKLDELLHSSEVRDYIIKTWPDKSVIPAE